MKSVANDRIYSASLRTGKASVINFGNNNLMLFFIVLNYKLNLGTGNMDSFMTCPGQ